MGINDKNIVWIPARIIKKEENMYFVQPLDGWSEHRLWTSNWKKFNGKIENRDGFK